VLSTYHPPETMISRNAFIELTRRVRTDPDGGIEALNDALGRGIRLILAHRTARKNVGRMSRRVLELTASELRSREIEPENIPRMIVSLIDQCAARAPANRKPAKKGLRLVSSGEGEAVA
jgi:hypothetical protein